MSDLELAVCEMALRIGEARRILKALVSRALLRDYVRNELERAVNVLEGK